MTLATKPQTRGDFLDGVVWKTKIERSPWWGNAYVAFRGEPFWESDRYDDIPKRNTRGVSFHEVIKGWCHAFREGELMHIRLGEPVKYDHFGTVTMVRIAHSVFNGRRILGTERGTTSDIYGRGLAAVNSRFAALVEDRCGPGYWHLTQDRKAFIFGSSKVEAVVMSIITYGTEWADDNEESSA